MNRVFNILSEIAHFAQAAAVNYWPVLLIFGLLALAIMGSVVGWILRMTGVLGKKGRKKKSSRSASSGATPSKGAGAPASVELPEPLQRLPKEHYTVFADLYLARPSGEGTTHLDYVVISRFGIFVIQVEEGNGAIFGMEEDKQWSWMHHQKVRTTPNPLWRNLFHVKALAHFLGLPEKHFHSLIYFPGEVTFKVQPPPNVLTSGLRRHILSQQELLLEADVAASAKTVLEVISRATNQAAAREEYRASKRRPRVGGLMRRTA